MVAIGTEASGEKEFTTGIHNRPERELVGLARKPKLTCDGRVNFRLAVGVSVLQQSEFRLLHSVDVALISSDLHSLGFVQTIGELIPFLVLISPNVAGSR